MRIDVQGISAGYVEDLFHDVTFTIGESDRIGVVGNNGVGKTMLLKCIANVLDTVSGKITYPIGVRIA
jgi:ABC transport system ATP-binding/permease protein